VELLDVLTSSEQQQLRATAVGASTWLFLARGVYLNQRSSKRQPRDGSLGQQHEGVGGSRDLAMIEAARHGYTARCAYLYAERCPWDAQSTNCAARGGHLDTLRFLIEHGCPWRHQTLLENAGESGSIAIFAYLQQLGLLTHTTALQYTLLHSGAYKHLAAAQWLRQQGAPWPAALYIRNYFNQRLAWHGEVLAWARAEGCDSPSDRCS
jgi:hypothetical protein